MRFRGLHLQEGLTRGFLCLLLGLVPSIGLSEIVWSGDFDDRNFLNWHVPGDPTRVAFHFVPPYGRPEQYGGQYDSHVGNGELLSLVPSPVRGGKYASKFMVKNSANGSEPADCDPATSCKNRRTTLVMTDALWGDDPVFPYNMERWVSVSFFLPSDFDTSGPGFGPLLWGSKGRPLPGWIGIQVQEDSWQIVSRYYSDEMKAQGVDFYSNWWLSTDYNKNSPSKSEWPQGLVDFPDEGASKAALGNLNLGGWTDFVLHFRTDAGPYERNSGFLDVYMRAGSGPWVHVLNILPMEDVAKVDSWVAQRPERLFDRGIGMAQGGSYRGYTSQIGLYMAKERVWNNATNMTVFIDNHKIGDQNATFEMMTHDGSAPDGPAFSDGGKGPKPPVVSVE